MGNGIIFGAAMAEKKIENGKVRYSAAYPTGREFCDGPYHKGLSLASPKVLCTRFADYGIMQV